MAKRKTWVDQLVAQRYFVWAVVFAIIVGAGLLAQISIAKLELDTDGVSNSFLTVPHSTNTNNQHRTK